MLIFSGVRVGWRIQAFVVLVRVRVTADDGPPASSCWRSQAARCVNVQTSGYQSAKDGEKHEMGRGGKDKRAETSRFRKWF